MANQAHSGIHGLPWGRCSRCGVDTRYVDLVKQDGLLFCRPNDCIDQDTVARRTRRIQEALQDGREMQPDPKISEPFTDESYDQL